MKWMSLPCKCLYSPFIFKPWASSIHNARLQVNFQVANVNSKFSSSIISDGTLGRKNLKKKAIHCLGFCRNTQL